jgi:hypothetical protein
MMYLKEVWVGIKYYYGRTLIIGFQAMIAVIMC